MESKQAGTEAKADFVPGLALSRSFFTEAVQPILGEEFPDLRYAAALLGSGSEVLGFDDAMSSDHHWGPRVQLFVDEAAHGRYAAAIHERLRHRLPHSFGGYPTNFSEPDPNDNGVQHLQTIDSGPVNHRVSVSTIARFLDSYLSFDSAQPIAPEDWLTFPQQKLRTLVAGGVFHDEMGLAEMRARFAWYPHDLWLYLLAAGWARIGQEEHLMGRAGFAGDEIGSALLGSRLVRDVMRLCFLMERQYAPYPKWFGSAFARLDCAQEFSATLRRALAAETWQARQDALIPAYEALARMHNRLSLTDPLPETVRDFWGRPFKVIAMQGFGDALLGRITDPAVHRIAQRALIGSVDQFSDNTDLLEAASLRTNLRQLYT